MLRSYVLPAFGILLTHAAAAEVVTITVGPTGTYHTLSAAVAAANADADPTDDYVISVAPGTYLNDFPPAITRPMTIEVDPAKTAQPVVLKATVPPPNQKGIILNHSNLTVDGLTFQGAAISDSLGGNGTGIRDQNLAVGATLVVMNSTFVGNQEGILTGANPTQSITVIKSIFKNNGNPNQAYFQHALYVGNAGSLTVSSSIFCGQLIGHDIKSRAQITTVSDNVLFDGQANTTIGCAAGSSSFAIDTPNGGVTTITGNTITQGTASQNYKMVAYGEEGLLYSANNLLVSHNTFTNIGSQSATGIYNPNCIAAQLVGNSFTGIATPVNPARCAVYE
jgi:hypothetical protein